MSCFESSLLNSLNSNGSCILRLKLCILKQFDMTQLLCRSSLRCLTLEFLAEQQMELVYLAWNFVYLGSLIWLFCYVEIYLDKLDFYLAMLDLWLKLDLWLNPLGSVSSFSLGKLHIALAPMNWVRCFNLWLYTMDIDGVDDHANLKTHWSIHFDL